MTSLQETEERDFIQLYPIRQPARSLMYSAVVLLLECSALSAPEKKPCAES